MNKPAIDLVSKKILESRNIAITSHLRPDGDSICTGLALYFMGKLLGKKMSIINKDRTPFPFNHFPDVSLITIGQIEPQGYDCIILLECANIARSGQKNIGDYFKINIDHHYSNDYYADINWVDPEASAVAEMVFLLEKKLDITITPQIANHLYCGIVSDTGSFQFSNTGANSFQTCYKLVKRGAIPIQVSELIYNNNPPEKIKLLGQILSTLKMNKKKTLAIITMFKKDLASLNLKEIETEDITTLARSIKGVQMVMFFKEVNKNTFRITLRSKGDTNAAQVAEHFGGGGHIHAAGFTVNGRYEDLLKEIPEIVEGILAKPQGKKQEERNSYPE
jgi:phosphoesterase RecJ-like protein